MAKKTKAPEPVVESAVKEEGQINQLKENAVRFEYIDATSKIAAVIEEMYTSIYADLATKTDDPAHFTLKLIQAGYDAAITSVGIKSNYKHITHKVGFSANKS